MAPLTTSRDPTMTNSSVNTRYYSYRLGPIRAKYFLKPIRSSHHPGGESPKSFKVASFREEDSYRYHWSYTQRLVLSRLGFAIPPKVLLSFGPAHQRIAESSAIFQLLGANARKKISRRDLGKAIEALVSISSTEIQEVLQELFDFNRWGDDFKPTGYTLVRRLIYIRRNDRDFAAFEWRREGARRSDIRLTPRNEVFRPSKDILLDFELLETYARLHGFDFTTGLRVPRLANLEAAARAKAVQDFGPVNDHPKDKYLQEQRSHWKSLDTRIREGARADWNIDFPRHAHELEKAFPLETAHITKQFGVHRIVVEELQLDWSIFRVFTPSGNKDRETDDIETIKRVEAIALHPNGLLKSLAEADNITDLERFIRVGCDYTRILSNEDFFTVSDARNEKRWDIVNRATGLAYRDIITKQETVSTMGGAKPTPYKDVRGNPFFKDFDCANPHKTISSRLSSENSKQICLADLANQDTTQYLYRAIHERFDGKILPPQHCQLEDCDVAVMMYLCHEKRAFNARFLHDNWSTTFNTTGFPHPSRRQMGRPAIIRSRTENDWRYVCVSMTYTLFGGGEFDALPQGLKEFDSANVSYYPWQRPNTKGFIGSYKNNKDEIVLVVDLDMPYRENLVQWPIQVDQARWSDEIGDYLSNAENSILTSVRLVSMAETGYRRPLPKAWDGGSSTQRKAREDIDYFGGTDPTPFPLESYEGVSMTREQCRVPTGDEVQMARQKLIETEELTAVHFSASEAARKIPPQASKWVAARLPVMSDTTEDAPPPPPPTSKWAAPQAPAMSSATGNALPPPPPPRLSDEVISLLTPTKMPAGSHHSSSPQEAEKDDMIRIQRCQAFMTNSIRQNQVAITQLDRSGAILYAVQLYLKKSKLNVDKDIMAAIDTQLKSDFATRMALTEAGLSNLSETIAILSEDVPLARVPLPKPLDDAALFKALGRPLVTTGHLHRYISDMVDLPEKLGYTIEKAPFPPHDNQWTEKNSDAMDKIRKIFDTAHEAPGEDESSSAPGGANVGQSSTEKEKRTKKPSDAGEGHPKKPRRGIFG
ncbi:hypothetical protein K431DRAFT_312371 [Polychaeton citri CBS 116435]|uniref:Uncharacterized protein n=1 Tax=Polychaeton citri CBS 116435 TaxID=1314669 RepID=A0A9P4UMX8_9PEZI|nr:hypothetical protein K431DRAFT_312371 [Polychaeton citri CBS 116435]